MKTYFRSNGKGPVSGGIRVGRIKDSLDTRPGEYVTLVPGRLIWGIHNFPKWIHKVGEGYHFNHLACVGDWHDFIPDFAVPDRAYIKRLGDYRSAKTLARLNHENGVFVLKIWDEDGLVRYHDLIAKPDPTRKQ